VLPREVSWPQPANAVALVPGEVHVWRASLALSDSQEAQRSACLSADERGRASRFLSAPARTQFIAARSALRAILARYLNRDPGEISFRLGPIGKPALADVGSSSVFFNLSHSHQLALVAVTRCGEIGVDVEFVREMASRDQLAERFFHPNEVEVLRELRADQRAEGFFNAWTRKEAFLKATGKGISYGIDRVEVTLAPGLNPSVVAVDGNRDVAAAWSLAALTPAPGYVGAVAMAERWERIVCYSQ
jgi:4'-phosphopantetheinyl transferase